MGIYGEVPGEKYRSVLDPYRDSAAVVDASDFKGHDVPLNGLSDLIVRLALTPGLHVRESIGVSRG